MFYDRDGAGEAHNAHIGVIGVGVHLVSNQPAVVPDNRPYDSPVQTTGAKSNGRPPRASSAAGRTSVLGHSPVSSASA